MFMTIFTGPKERPHTHASYYLLLFPSLFLILIAHINSWGGGGGGRVHLKVRNTKILYARTFIHAYMEILHPLTHTLEAPAGGTRTPAPSPTLAPPARRRSRPPNQQESREPPRSPLHRRLRRHLYNPVVVFSPPEGRRAKGEGLGGEGRGGAGGRGKGWDEKRTTFVRQ